MEVVTPKKKFYRKHQGAILGGVCVGLSDYFKVDVTFVRVLFVLFGLWGAGEIIYILFWLLTPYAPTQ